MDGRQNRRSNNKRVSDGLLGEDSATKRHKQTGKCDRSTSSANVQGQAQGTVTGSSFMFNGLKIFILETGIGKTRRDLFGKQIKNNGGEFVQKFMSSSGAITHVVVDEKMELCRMCKILKVDADDLPESLTVVKSTWMSSCLKVKKLISTEGHELKRKRIQTNVKQKSSDGVETKADSKDRGGVPFRFSTGFGEKIHAEGSDSETKESKLAKVESTFDELLQSPELVHENTDDSGTSDEEADADDEPPRPKFVPMFGHKACQKKAKSGGHGSDPDSDYIPSGDEEETGGASGSDATPSPSTSPLKNFPTGNWICSKSSKSGGGNVNHNEHVTAKLEQMATLYQNTNDRWRAFGYNKAVAALKRHPKKITTWEEAKAIPGVGAKLADKIWEIVESGQLRKLDELSSREDVATLTLFMNLWGAGPTTARQWLQMGLKTLDDVREKANLTKQQKIGLAHYDDFLDRMPREEAAEIEARVKRTCHEMDPGLIARACGSFRRGKSTCGDVDVLVTHPDGKSHKGIFAKLLTNLKEEGFITDDLVSHEQIGNQKKYLGVCKLPGENRKFRRLDIIVVPYDEYACALVYFTGSAHFNRSLRHLAKKNNMSLNEHALCVGVVRKGGEKIHKGTPVATPSEESIFKHFGLKYRPPEERDH